MTATQGEWVPEAHTGLPQGFSLQRREVPEYGMAEYRISFRAGHTVALSPTQENDREHRDATLQHALHSLAHFIADKTKEITA